MENKKEQISSYVLLFSIGCFLQSSIFLLSVMSSITGHDTWIVAIAGTILTLPIIWMYISLSGKFPGKSLIEINDIVFGKILGKAFSVLYIFFFFSLSAFNTRNVGDFVTGTLLPETPMPAILIFFVILCCFAVRKGLETMTRYSALFVLIIVGVLIINGVLLIKDMKFSNFQPAFTLPSTKYIQATQTQIFLPFSEIIVFFMLFPNLKKPKDIVKPLFGGLAIGALTFFIVAIRDIAVLGPLISYMTNPAYEAVRFINLAGVLTRMEMFYAIILIMLNFFKVTILTYATLKGIEQVLNLSSYKFLVPVVGALVLSFSIIVFDTGLEHSYWTTNVASVYSMFFELILPLITLIAASIRGFHKSKEVKAS